MGTCGHIAQVGVALTARCNLSCSYCYQNARRRGRMSWRTLCAGVDLLLSSPCRDAELVFLGGEPLLEFDLLRRAALYARQRVRPDQALRLSVTTNGTLLTDEVAAFLAAEAVDTQLSCDGIRAAQDARGATTFGCLDRLLDRVRERWPDFFRRNLAVVMTLTPDNVPHLADSLDYLLDKDVRRILLGPLVTRCPKWRLQAIEEMEVQFERVVEGSLRHLERTGRAPLALLGERPRPAAEGREAERDGLPACGVLRNESVTVDVGGEAYGCAAFAESYQRPTTALMREAVEATRLGRLSEKGFTDRFRALPQAAARLSLFAAKERKRSGYRNCADCPHVDDCVVCPAAIAHGGDDPDRIPDFLCAYNLVSLRHRRMFPKVPGARDRVRGWGLRNERVRTGNAGEEALAAESALLYNAGAHSPEELQSLSRTREG